MSQTKLESPADLLRFQLRTALSMEDDSLAALHDLKKAARSPEVKHLFTHHAEETLEQIDRLQQVFRVLEFPVSTAGSPGTKGISKQAHALLDRTAPMVRDHAALSAALGNEHYEISVYQAIIVAAEAKGADEAVQLLTENLQQEVHTSEELLSTLEQLSTP